MSRRYEGTLLGERLKFAIVISRFNDFITTRLLQGSQDALLRHGVNAEDIDTAWTPGCIEIPLIAKILTLVDSYDNMLNSPYLKRKRTQQDAIEEVKRCTGSQFDPKIADALLNIIKKS